MAEHLLWPRQGVVGLFIPLTGGWVSIKGTLDCKGSIISDIVSG